MPSAARSAARLVAEFAARPAARVANRLPLGLPLARRLVQLFQLGQLLQVSYVLILQVLPGFRLFATVVVNRISLDVVLADHLRDRTNRLHVVMKIGDVQEARLLQADVDERRLHPGQHARDLAFVDVAGKAAMLLAFEIELGQRAVFEQRDAHFERARVNDNFTFHERPGGGGRTG